MSKESLVKKTNISTLIKTDAAVDMNSIVAFFISKYENNLLESKKKLSERVTELTTYLNKDFVTEVEKEVKIESFNVNVKALGLITKATISFDQQRLLSKIVVVNIRNTDDTDNQCSFQMWKEKIISDELHKKYVDTTNEITELRSSLREVLDNLSSVSRKERELRGALAEKTLRAAGAGDLFDDQSLLDLVSAPSLSMKVVSEP